MARPHASVVVLDVDGVVFHGQFLLEIGLRHGILSYLKCIWDGLRFERGLMSIEHLLDRAYAYLKGKPPTVLDAIYDRMRLSTGVAEAVSMLHEDGVRVLLVSSGVPQHIVENLARRLGADLGAGIIAEEDHGRLTGRVGGELASEEGKVAFVDRYLRANGFTWDDVAVVGDDRNNIPLMELAGQSIGYKSSYAVRKMADEVIDRMDLRTVAAAVRHPRRRRDTEPRAEQQHPVRRRPWYREIRRKVVHASAAVLALVEPYLGAEWRLLLPGLLCVVCGMYMLSEYFRLNGLRFPLFSSVTQRVLREQEKRRLAYAPLSLAAGIFICILAFPEAAPACILIVALADSVGAVVGERWGRIRLPHNRVKTLEGSASFFVTSCACTLFLDVPALPALAAAATATLIESMNIRGLDNLLVPIAAGFVIQTLSFA